MPGKVQVLAEKLQPQDPIDELNKRFFVIEEGGKHFVASEWFDPARRRKILKRYTFEEFKKRYLGQEIDGGEGQRPRRLANAWLESKRRRQYLGGVVFDPTDSSSDDVYNLWGGWAVTPRQGDWGILRDHLRDVLCAGDRQAFDYVMGWLRRLVQHPELPGEVVPVFRGPQGAGKTMFCDAVKRMFGQHAMSVSSPRAVTGQFNAHLRDLVFLLANEAFFAGDRAAVSTLKALITDETLFIEQKGIDAVEVPNFLHIVMTTNSSWAVPVALDDRRFAVFDVSPRRAGDRTYFRELHAAVDDDAVIGAMLHDLLLVPLGPFDVRDIPSTQARHEQMVQSLDGEAAWLFHVLALGDLGAHNLTGWPQWASTKALQDSHENWARNGRHRHAVDPATLGRFLGKFFRSTRPRQDDGSRDRGYALGDLEAARARFREVTSLSANVFPSDAAGPDAEAP